MKSSKSIAAKKKHKQCHAGRERYPPVRTHSLLQVLLQCLGQPAILSKKICSSIRLHSGYLNFSCLSRKVYIKQIEAKLLPAFVLIHLKVKVTTK